ncbi:MAG TPA: LLM class flavin-dependent oxidoreductase [Polyangiales bacterium]|nr:LLM class flavin-dependent oxidoreductase [Polyangiales bacterium]
MPPISLLDLCPVLEGGTARDALRNTLDLARHAERWGYHRFWLAEHHSLPGVASSATSVVMAAVGSVTSTIRIGAGGIMLPNHAPLLIAEQFGTLESLYPGRIDLGLGRAPGSDQITQRALRRGHDSSDRFPEDVLELQAWFREAEPQQAVRAVPGAGLSIPLWILGSSLFGAQLAAALGLPFAFASHFAPAQLAQAVASYRAQFQPSQQLDKPYVMLGMNVVVAETDEQARLLATSLHQAFANLRRGRPGPLPPPRADFDATLSELERNMLQSALLCSAVGSPETVRRLVRSFVERTGADELILASQVYDHDARLRSFELAIECARG